MPLPRRALLVSALVLGSLAACRTAPPQAPIQPIDFSNFGPIVLNVAAIDVVDSRRPVPGAIDERAPTPPLEALKRWASQRLQAAGGRGRARVTITEASLVEAPLPVTGGVKGFFTNEQALRYDGRMTVEVSGEIPGETTVRGTARATATASATVAEKSSIAEREAAMQEVVRTMSDALNARLDAGIRKDLARLVVR